MVFDLNTYLQMPGVRRFLLALRDDMAQGRSVLVLLPRGVDAGGLWAALRHELWQRSYSVGEVFLPDLPAGAPVPALAEALGATWPSPDTQRTLSNLLCCEGLPDVVRLEGVEYLDDGLRRRWLGLLSDWAKISQGAQVRNQPPPVLCALTSAVADSSDLPPTDVRLSVRWWWGVLSTLELRLMCRLEDGEASPDSSWREHLLAALAGDHLELASYLWEDTCLPSDVLVSRLTEFAAEKGWTKAALVGWGADHVARFSKDYGRKTLACPPEPLQRLWTCGALQWTAEQGLELHPAAMAALGMEEDIRHRLWRAQASLLLPLIDGARLKICAHLTNAYGRAWPIKWLRPESHEEERAVGSNPFACQLGYLKHLLRKCHNLKGEWRWLPLVEQAHWTRNELAHYRPIDYTHFELLSKELRRLG